MRNALGSRSIAVSRSSLRRWLASCEGVAVMADMARTSWWEGPPGLSRRSDAKRRAQRARRRKCKDWRPLERPPPAGAAVSLHSRTGADLDGALPAASGDQRSGADEVARRQVAARQDQFLRRRADARQDPGAQPRELVADEGRHRVADVAVHVRQRAAKGVVPREALEQCHLPHRAEPILLRMGISAVADVSALSLDGDGGLVPPQPAIDVRVTAKIAALDSPGHGR